MGFGKTYLANAFTESNTVSERCFNVHMWYTINYKIISFKVCGTRRCVNYVFINNYHACKTFISLFQCLSKVDWVIQVAMHLAH